MKPTFLICTLVLLITSCFTVNAQSPTDSTGLPGDNFSLEGALELFKKSSSPEDFEKKLNAAANDVNNLDLNDDGEVDYIKVIDQKEGDAHAIVLQVPVTETESQDIAVIEIEKTGESSAIIQIIGDEEIFGESTIIEPSEEQRESALLFRNANPVHGPAASDVESNGIIVNVWFWPSVRFMYAPTYVVWRSPWAWRARPIWWNPWRPVRYSAFYPRRIVYRPRYVVVHTHRVTHAHRIYRPMRTTSVTVRTRHQVAHDRYNVSRTTTTVNGKNVQAKRKTTTVQGPKGNKVSRTKTTLKKKRRG